MKPVVAAALHALPASEALSETEVSSLGKVQGDTEGKRDVEVGAARPSMAAASRKKLIACSLGIFVCYFYYGIIQERITKRTYGSGDSTERFTYTISLVFVQCIINAIAAKIVLQVSSPVEDRTSNLLYAICAFSYIGAMLASNQSLQHVPYPLQVVGKSCKPIPVMILGVLLAAKRYPLQKYMFVLMIVIGVALFVYKDSGSTSKSSDSVVGFGEILLLVSLTLDGVTGAVQERMRAGYKTQSSPMMMNINLWSMLYLVLAEVWTGELWTFILFIQRNPNVIFDIGTFGLASALGQYFIFLTVAEFGPLVCSIATTTRKFFTVLASVFFFGNVLIARQWFGTVLVFSGLALDSIYGKSKK